MGNIAVTSDELIGKFPPQLTGDNATLPCDFVECGKFRSGPPRSWCAVHQIHWGRKADWIAAQEHGEPRCSNHGEPMSYVKDPFTLKVQAYAEVGVWCSLPPAISTMPVNVRAPAIHVHTRRAEGETKEIDGDFPAIAVDMRGQEKIYGDDHITRINITPPAALDFVIAIEEGRDVTTIDCARCGFPHLDLGSFARTPHVKHTCGNCGWDHTWSKTPIISNPLKRLRDRSPGNRKVSAPDRHLDLDEFDGYDFQVWASTPAILWTANRPMESGIHVHVLDGDREIIDDTFGTVTLKGKPLERDSLFQAMLAAARL